MPSECCDEYKLIQLYQKSSVWCFTFSHASTFELILAVTNGSTRSHGNSTLSRDKNTEDSKAVVRYNTTSWLCYCFNGSHQHSKR